MAEETPEEVVSEMFKDVKLGLGDRGGGGGGGRLVTLKSDAELDELNGRLVLEVSASLSLANFEGNFGDDGVRGCATALILLLGFVFSTDCEEEDELL